MSSSAGKAQSHQTVTGPKTTGSAHFERKRTQIIEAATVLINQRGIKGATFQELSQAVGLSIPSITYYFRLKEQLAVAVFTRTLERLEELVAEAAQEPSPRERISRFYELHFQRHAAVIRGEATHFVILSDMRSLDEPARGILVTHYMRIFYQVCAFLPVPTDDMQAALVGARAHVVMEIAFWLPAWLTDYAISDFPRVCRRLVEVLEHGMAAPGAAWSPTSPPQLGTTDADASAEDGSFLQVATRLMNEIGYVAASVDRIVAEMRVTKGSFYHRLDAKDDLVLDCFRHSYRRIARAQRLADAEGGSHWQRLVTTMATLVDAQFAGEWPLLRTTALQALPINLRLDVVERSNRNALRFAGMLCDGMSEGSVRLIDPTIASQVLMAAINGAYELRDWASQLGRERALSFYISTVGNGIFCDMPAEVSEA